MRTLHCKATKFKHVVNWFRIISISSFLVGGELDRIIECQQIIAF